MMRSYKNPRRLLWTSFLWAYSCGDPSVIMVPESQICPPSASRCNGDILELCSRDGRAIGTLTCPLGCKDNQCVTAECTPNLKSCVDPKIAEHCSSDGVSNLFSCDFTCINGECVDLECNPGISFCDPSGDKIQRCSPDGLTITVQQECPYGCDPAKVRCLDPLCAPDEVRCGTDGNPEICNPSQTGFEPVPNISCEESCENGECVVSACTPGARRCAVGRVEQCRADGTGFDLALECIYGCISDGQGDAQCAKCVPDTVSCAGDQVQTCLNPLAGWSTGTPCDNLESCIQGACAPVIALEGSPTADALRILLSSAIADCWMTMLTSPKNGPVTICRGIDTTAMTGDLKKSDLVSWFCDNQGKALTADDFSSDSHFNSAKTVYGCGILDLQDLTVSTTSQSIHAGLFQAECIAHHASKKEIIIAPCPVLN